MSESPSRDDIRRLLKTFGVRADELMVAHLARHPEVGALHVRLTLEDLTVYGTSVPDSTLSLVVEGSIRRESP